jgi:hypothetical protein
LRITEGVNHIYPNESEKGVCKYSIVLVVVSKQKYIHHRTGTSDMFLGAVLYFWVLKIMGDFWTR